MIYAYIRVSTEKQSVENQRFEIKRFAKLKNVKISKWFEETVSSMKKIEERKLNTLLKGLKSDDIVIYLQISRMGRNLMQIMSILNLCIEH